MQLQYGFRIEYKNPAIIFALVTYGQPSSELYQDV